MQQFTDGTFGAIEPASDLLKRLAESVPDNLKAVHFGTLVDLEKLRNPPPATSAIVDAPPAVDFEAMRQQVEELTARMNEFTMQSHVQGVRVYPANFLHALAA